MRRQAGVEILKSPRLSAAVLEFTTVDERVASLCLRESSDYYLCSLPLVRVCGILGGPGWGHARGMYSDMYVVPEHPRLNVND